MIYSANKYLMIEMKPNTFKLLPNTFKHLQTAVNKFIRIIFGLNAMIV